MEKLLETIASQVPGLCVLSVIVKWFLAHLKSRDDFIKTLHNEHMIARKESRDALENATKAMQEIRDTIKICKLHKP